MNAGKGKRRMVHVMLLCVWLSGGLLPEVTIAAQAHVRSDAFDVVHYEMMVATDPAAQKLSATVAIDIHRALAPLADSLDFPLDRQYTVTSVHREDGTLFPFERILDGEPLSELHPGNADRLGWAFLRVPSSIFMSGERQRMIVEYEGGKAIGMLKGSTMFQMHSVYARWYPYRYDDPATATCTIVAPDSMRAVFGGRGIAVREEGNGRRSRQFQTEFALDYFPLLVGKWEETHLTDGDIELMYLHKAGNADTDRVLRNAAQYLHILRRPWMLGRYPYSQLVLVEYPPEEGLSIAMPGGLIGYGGASGEAFAHQIAHLWWGAGVFTARDRDRAFLNEAFATYSGALVAELAWGTDRMTEGFINQQVRNHASLLKDHDLTSPVELNYGKGAYVVHLLRRVMGMTSSSVSYASI